MNKIKKYSKLLLIPLLFVIIINGCEDRLGITNPPVITIPTVSSTSPANAATAVAVGSKITATFSEPMNSSTITTATFTLMQGTSFVSGTVSYTGTTATFTPSSNLASNTTYTATITTGAHDSQGSAVATNYVWNFTTAAAVVILPTVSTTDPVNTATGVALNKQISATFSVAMDATTIQNSTFSLMQGTTTITGFVSYSIRTATFTAASNLAPNTLYTATITTGAKDLSGNALANNYVWSFTTGASAVITPPTVISTDPVNLATGVALNKQIIASFSKIMDASTITTATFTLIQGTTFVAGTVSYAGITATFAPSSNLIPNTLYTATITTGAKDLAGNTLASNFVWSFTTAATPYTVTLSSIPALGGTATGGGTFNSGSSVTVTAAPNAGYTFTNWTENGIAVSATANYQFTISGNRTLVANFSAVVVQYTVTLSSNPLLGGIVTQSGSGPYNSGSSVTVTATPNAGYTFTNWKENGIAVPAANASYTFTISGNRVLEANFTAVAPTQYTVTLTSNPLLGGTATQSGNGTYNSGSSVTVTATPNAGYTFTNWTENGIAVSTNSNYQFNIIQNRSLVANFSTSVSQYTVSLSSNPLIGGTTSGGGSFNSGALVTVTATPNSGYTFTSWTEGVTIASSNANYTFTITSNKILVANFTASGPSGPAGVNLGSAGNFAVLAGSGVSNTGVTTHIYGDVGSFPTATINGLLAGNVTGILYTTADPIVGAAKNDLTTAYNDAQGRSLNAISLPGQLGGLTLAPGLYVNSSSTGISGTGSNAILTLDAGGNANAVWIFKTGSTLVTDAGTSIVLAGGAQWSNIYWSVGTSATLGTNSTFYGNILADQAITLTTGAKLYGRALTRIAAVTLDSGIIDKR
ncbi:MAG: hypothetical protein CVV24_04645 [Ignavibacteriae bacterium HGW-Ignavibacteriae-3]|nr:MAG: hypothetical protein CVV24_04645 [Ignavibacteriae bacterium HGW-Ignavibacteriae-3]